MTRLRFLTLSLAASALLGGCGTMSAGAPIADPGFASAPVVSLRVGEGAGIQPRHIILTKDQPVRIRAFNGTGATTLLTAPGLNGAASFGPGDRLSQRLWLDPGDTAEISMVPREAGNYLLGPNEHGRPWAVVSVR